MPYLFVSLYLLLFKCCKNDISINGYSQNSDLFQKGNKFINVKWYNGQAANFTITVNDIVVNSTANITIEYK